MKATVNQSATERNITLVSLANIQPSSFNPRKYFSEPALYELAESIRQQGVLQPITVRPIANTDQMCIRDRIYSSLNIDYLYRKIRRRNLKG